MLTSHNPTPTVAVSVAPTSEPVTRAEVKKQLELPNSTPDHDLQLDRLITLAREQVEADTGHVGFSTTYVQKYDYWPADYLELLRFPLISVTSISYLDTGGDSQTWSSANYEVDTARAVPVIWPGYQVTFPSLRSIQNAVTVTYLAGYATVAAIPQLYKQAVLLAVSREFGDREGNMNPRFDDAYEALIQRLRRSSYP